MSVMKRNDIQLVRGSTYVKSNSAIHHGVPISDEALMEAITEQRPEALNEFYSRHGGRLKSVIGNVVHEEGDADDVLQDILLQIWHEADHYSPKAGKLLGWVVTLAAGGRSIGFAANKPTAARRNVTRNI